MVGPLPLHSPLGASSAERWIACPGSVRLLQLLGAAESDEEDWRTEGVAAHEAAAHCLVHGEDAWERVGEMHGEPAIAITDKLANPLQTYLDHCRRLKAARGDKAEEFIEYRVSSNRHRLMYGTLDHGIIGLTLGGIAIDLTDLKMGEGVYVEVEDNVQEMYYGFCLIDGLETQHGRKFADTNAVNLHIVQPRFGGAEPVRTWETSVGTLKSWAHGVLIPAMKETELNDGLDAGPWCRFCPAKTVCPLLTAMFGAAMKANPKHTEGMSIQRLAMEYQAAKAVKIYITAVEKETFKLLSAGEEDPRVKMVKKRAIRAWRPGAEEETKAKFGPQAMTEPKLKSPAQIEELPGGPDWVKGKAFTPDTGLTVALATDPGTPVKVPKPAERFAGALAAQAEEW